MAISAARACSRCGTATRAGRFCERCRPPGVPAAAAKPVAGELRPNDRPSAAVRGYGRKWRMARLQFLAQPQHQICVICRSALATVVDHITPHRGDPKLFWRRSNWQGLCETCHNRKTAQGA